MFFLFRLSGIWVHHHHQIIILLLIIANAIIVDVDRQVLLWDLKQEKIKN